MLDRVADLQTLPPQPTSFVGRERDLAAVARLLAGPACRQPPRPHPVPRAPQPADRGALDALVAGLAGELLAPGVAASPPPLPAAPATLRPSSPLPDPLTERELEVLRLIAAGPTNREIAGALYLTVSTVKWYAGEIFGKLGAGNRTEAVARAREPGVLA